MKMKWLKGIAILLVIGLFILSPTAQFVKSILVMRVYSASEANESVLKDEGFDIKIPGGLSTPESDWYPFVMTFNDDHGFSRFMERDLRMTVLYNFAYFPWNRSYSEMYNPKSPYYGAFYGAYAVQHLDDSPFGYANGTIDYDEVSNIPIYDMKYLVLYDFGLSQPYFDYQLGKTFDGSFLGYDDWDGFQANLAVSGVYHTYQKDYQSYIQYGRPPYGLSSEDFKVVPMVGRIYARYFEENHLTLFFYCIAPNETVVEEWETNIMQKTSMTYKGVTYRYED